MTSFDPKRASFPTSPITKDDLKSKKDREKDDSASVAKSHSVMADGKSKGASLLDAAVNYHPIKLSDLVIEQKDKSFLLKDKSGRFDQKTVSQRFFASLSRKTGLRTDFFKLFTPCEVLDRVIAVEGDQTLLLAEDGALALGLSKFDDPLVQFADAIDVLSSFKPTSLSYHEGELKAEFTPARASGDTEITGEAYTKKFQLTLPIDGLSHPSVSPLMIRQICENGLVGEAPAFTSQIVIGRKDAGYTIDRALKAYNGDQFFTKIAERLELSKKSWASVAEVEQFVKLLIKSKLPPAISTKMVDSVWKVSGTVAYMKHLENQGKNPKLLRKVATRLNRYDLINMITEARTHLVDREGERRDLDAFVGTMIVRDPDLERSAEDDKPSVTPAFFFSHIA